MLVVPAGILRVVVVALEKVGAELLNATVRL